MATRAMYVAFAVIAAMLVLVGTGCERQPEGTQVLGQPSDLVDETYDTGPLPAPGEEGPQVELTITSGAFADGDVIPARYTPDGENISPPLAFSAVPEGTVELALIVHDPDAPREGGWTHWVVYGMSPDIGGLPEALPAEGLPDGPTVVQGTNTGGEIGYMGPAPPPGQAHRYQFRLYALSERTGLEQGATHDELQAAMLGRIIDEAMLEGLYRRD